MHIFKFSVRKGTRAEKMDHQIPEPIKTERSNTLLALNEKLQAEYRKSFLGKKENILFEEFVTIDGEEYAIGHNERYLKIAVPVTGQEKELINTIVPVFVEKDLKGETMIGKIG